VKEGAQLFLDAARLVNDASLCTDDPSLKRNAAFCACSYLAIALVAPFTDQWSPEGTIGSEAQLVESCRSYSTSGSGPSDHFLHGTFAGVVALYFGNTDVVAEWLAKARQAWAAFDLPTTVQFGDHLEELVQSVSFTVPVLLLLDRPRDVHALFRCWGFTWDAAGVACMDAFGAAFQARFGSSHSHHHHHVQLALRLCVFLSLPGADVMHGQCGARVAGQPAELQEWLPAPVQVAELERRAWGHRLAARMGSIINTAAHGYLKLGREDDAVEMASIAVSREQGTLQKCVLVDCRCLLGRVAMRRGNVDAAEGHFAEALMEAKASRLPLMEVIAAREWGRHAPEAAEAHGRDWAADCAAAKRAIDAACTRMGKTRGQLEGVLL
jgi:hypothetical protein